MAPNWLKMLHHSLLFYSYSEFLILLLVAFFRLKMMEVERGCNIPPPEWIDLSTNTSEFLSDDQSSFFRLEHE